MRVPLLRRPRHTLSVALVTALAIAFGGASALARKPAAKGKATVAQPAPVADKAAPKAPPSALLSAADEITRQVAALRGLPPKMALQRGVLTRVEIGTKLKERLDKEYTPAEVRAEARVLKRLGLLPADADYGKLLLDLLMEQVAGFYDPFAGKLYIADWLPLEMQRPAMAHEIEHALQDQYFDLKRFAQPIKDDGDRQLARSALVEGDGTMVMLEFQLQAMGGMVTSEQLSDVVAAMGKQLLQSSAMNDTPLFKNAPPFLKETLMFPYLAGLNFIAQLKRSQPWTRIDEVWKSPPSTTEQVLHPEKYLAKEAGVVVTPAALPSLGARKELRRDVLGELEMRVLFSQVLPDAEAEKAAAGWGGDRLVAFADPASEAAPPTVVSLSAWDSETDAREAEAAARRLIEKLVGKPLASGRVADPNGDEWAVERRGDKVLILFGAPAGTGATVAAEVWKGWRVGA
jgi:hypothetical protein